MLWSRALFSQLRPSFIPLKMSSIFVKIQTGAEQKNLAPALIKKFGFLRLQLRNIFVLELLHIRHFLSEQFFVAF